MSTLRSPMPRRSERMALRLAAGLTLALLSALPVLAAEDAPVQAANWTVFLSTGSSIAATEVHHDKTLGRYTLKLEKGGYIHLSSDAVLRVSHDTKDRVEKAAPLVASSTGSPRAGAVPGAVDSSNVAAPPMRSTAVSVSANGESLKDRASDRIRPTQVGLGGERVQGRRPANDSRFTPRPGMMEQMLKQTNSRPRKSRR